MKPSKPIKKRYFPCPICHGQGGEKQVILDDGSGPYYECDYCNGEGLIEIGGKRHREIMHSNIAIDAVTKFKPERVEWSYGELISLGKKIEKLVKD